MDDPDMWIEVCNMQTQLFQHIMLMALDNLAIA